MLLNRKFVCLTLIIFCSSTLWGKEDARALLKASEDKHRTSSQEYAGDLTVVNKEGKERKKGWRSYREGYAGDAKSLIRFTNPPEVKGVGFLSLSRPGGESPDQWLYLPSMKRERRIATQDRDASFVGTDFNYEDMEEFDHAKYEVSLKDNKTVDGQLCYVIEATPIEKGQKSIYQKKILTLRKDILFLIKDEIYRKGESEPSKIFLQSDLQQVEGHWVAKKMEMTDLKKGSKTTVLLKEIVFDKAQPATRFTLQNLNREGGD